jgi:hypothetical protein
MTVIEQSARGEVRARAARAGMVWRALRACGITMLAGMAGGVVWGVGARAAMRAIALAAGHRPDFSWGGTLGILLLGAFVGGLAGLPYLAVRRLAPAGRGRRALAYCLLVMLTLGPLVYLSPPFQGEAASTGQLGLAVALFAPLLVILGWVVVAVTEALDRRLLRPGAGRIATALGAALLALPALFEAGVAALIYLTAIGQVQL